jgi:YD repeat-containing protein
VAEPGASTGSSWAPLQPQLDGVQTVYTTLERNRDGNVTGVSYDVASMPTSNARVTNIVYGGTEGIFPVQVTNPLKQVFKIESSPGLGLPTRIVDPNGHATLRAYDGFGRLSHQSRPGSPSRTLTFEDVAPAEGAYKSIEAFTTGRRVSVFFDIWDRPIEVRTQSRPDGKEIRSSLKYDHLNRIARLSDPYFAFAASRWTTYRYDPLDRIVLERHPDGGAARYVYGDATPLPGSTIDELRQATIFDPLNHARVLAADDLGRIVKAVEHDDTHEFLTTYNYGPFNELRLISGPSMGNIELRHDRLGRLRFTKASDLLQKEFRYNAFGDLTDEIAPEQATKYERDRLGRPKTITSIDGETVLTWDTRPNGVGQIASARSPFGVVTEYGYDPAGLLNLKRTTLDVGGGKETHDFRFDYDADGRVRRITYPTRAPSDPRLVIRYDYGNYGDLIDVTDDIGATAFWTWLGADPSNMFQTFRLGNGLRTRWSEDPIRPNHLGEIKTVLPAGGVVQHHITRRTWTKIRWNVKT